MSRATRVMMVYLALGASMLLLVAANLCMGTIRIPLDDIVRLLVQGPAEVTESKVLWDIRIPRLVAAALLGGALSLAGMLMQAFFNNPIAGPYILGISSGSKLAVALLMVVVVGAQGHMSAWMRVVAATLGALLVMACMLAVSRHVRSASTLVLAGVMMGYLLGAATDFVTNFASDASIVSLRNWSMGSFSGIGWQDVQVMAVVVCLGAICAFCLSKPLDAYLLGERYAQSVGVNVGRFRALVIVLSSVLAACVTAFAGPISFVGIAVPHIARRLLGTTKPLLLIPAVFLGGSVFCLLSDLVARLAFAPTEMSVSTVTAALGAPVVLWVLLRRRREEVLA